MTAAVPVPAVPEQPASPWCNAAHPFADLVICRRVRHGSEVLHSTTDAGIGDWADEPTPNEETNCA